MKNCTALLAAILMTTTCYSQIKQPVHIDSGLVSGVFGRDPSITAFKGIPYAEPPMGNLGWAEPRPPHHWEGIRRADHFSDGCVQNFPKGDFPKSEDCLYLNVWTPAKARAALPVMVYIHGGGLRVGSAREALYDVEELARKGIVVVTLNYRLGILGFFAHPELTKESRYNASGNYGLLDQNAALQQRSKSVARKKRIGNSADVFHFCSEEAMLFAEFRNSQSGKRILDSFCERHDSETSSQDVSCSICDP